MVKYLLNFIFFSTTKYLYTYTKFYNSLFREEVFWESVQLKKKKYFDTDSIKCNNPILTSSVNFPISNR